jgi:hypothetical protein
MAKSILAMTLDSPGLEHIFPRTRIGENDDGPFTHRCTQVFKGERVNTKYSTPQANFKTLDNKNSIKTEIGGPPPPRHFFLKALHPP